MSSAKPTNKRARYADRTLIERWRIYDEGKLYCAVSPGMTFQELQAMAIAEMERCSVYSPPPLPDPRGCPPILQRLRDERDSHYPLKGLGRSHLELITDTIDELERLAMYVPPILYPYPKGGSLA